MHLYIYIFFSFMYVIKYNANNGFVVVCCCCLQQMRI